MPSLVVRGVAYLPHQVHTVSNHDEYDAHVLGKRKQQVAEVLAFNDWILFVEGLYALQAVQDAPNGITIFRTDLIGFKQAAFNARIEHDGQYGIAAKTNLIYG